MRAVSASFAAELMKLRFQLRVWIILLICAIAPWFFMILIKGQDRLPTDSPYGRYLKTTGYAAPLMTLGFMALWGFPLLTSFVSGDLFSSEDQQGTIKTIVTRSVSRRAIFWGKVGVSFAWSTAVLVLLAISTTLAGVVVIGSNPLVSLGGTEIAPGRALALVAASWGVSLIPFLGFACLALMISVLSRNSVIGVMLPVVIGFLMQFYAFLNGKDLIRHSLLTTPFHAWHGLLDDPISYSALTRGLVVSLAYIAITLAIAYRTFMRRDITGG